MEGSFPYNFNLPKIFKTRKELEAWVDSFNDRIYIVEQDEKFNGISTMNIKKNGQYEPIQSPSEIKQERVEVDTAPKEIIIDVPFDSTCKIRGVSVFKEIEAGDYSATLLTFNAADKNKFIENEFIEFKNGARLKSTFRISGETNIMDDSGSYIRSFKIDKSKFKNITSIEMIGGN